jgi:hypothetical protein
MSAHMQPKKHLEINHVHLVILKIFKQFGADAENKSTKEMIHLLLDT